MAITGSTRMQATTTELLVVGAAIEIALTKHVGCAVHTISSYRQLFANLLHQLSSPQAVAAIARAVELEEEVYRNRGLVTYLADSLMLDVLTDTTERAPTFMLPPFRRQGDAVSPVSWSFVKDPHRTTEQAWREMLQREPRGLTWGQEVYAQLNAPASIQANPPKLDNAEIHKFRIGNETDPSRTNAPDSMLVQVNNLRSQTSNLRSQISDWRFAKAAAITFGPSVGQIDVDEHIHVPCDLPASPLRLWEHLAIKLILNTLSTATMVRMGRVIGNAMVWVSPSNKKLIDRGCRLIAQETGCTYEHACEVLHEAMEELAERSKRGEEIPSPVAVAIERIGRTEEKEDA